MKKYIVINTHNCSKSKEIKSRLIAEKFRDNLNKASKHKHVVLTLTYDKDNLVEVEPKNLEYLLTGK